MSSDWELCKENAMPIKRGRDPKARGLGGVGVGLSAQREAKRREAEQEEFEEAVAHARSDGSMEDPLTTWIEYIRWFQDNYPSGSNELIMLFERCTREFKDDERYRNDERYLKVWIGYADRLDNPSSVFKYLRENKIGEKLALYYIATAWTAERRGDFPLADKAYSVGLEKRAEPVALLQKRQSEFQRRMSRRWLDQAEKSRTEDDVDEDELAAAERAQRSLQPLSRREARSQHRPVVRPGDAPRARGLGSGVGRAAGLSGNANVLDESAAGGGFSVFVDRKASTRLDDWGDQNSENKRTGWQNLESRDQQQKENSAAPAPWTDQGFSGAGAPSRAAASESGSSFSVFVDSDTKESQTRAPREDEAGDASSKLRERPGKKSELEALMKKPLRNFEREDAAPTTRAPSAASPVAGQASAFELDRAQEQQHQAPPGAVPSPAPEVAAEASANSSQLELADQDDMTINTRLAMDDMFELFGSPSMKNLGGGRPLSQDTPESTGPSPAAAPRPAFSIFQEPSSQAPRDVLADEDQENAGPRRISPTTVDESRALQEVRQPMFALSLDAISDDEDDEEAASSRRRRVAADSGHSDAEAEARRGISQLLLSEDEDDQEDEEEESKHDSLFMRGPRTPRGFRDVPSRPAGEPFSIFQDPSSRDDDRQGAREGSLSFAPLESILEASGELDASLNTTATSGRSSFDSHRQDRSTRSGSAAVPFSIFED